MSKSLQLQTPVEVSPYTTAMHPHEHDEHSAPLDHQGRVTRASWASDDDAAGREGLAGLEELLREGGRPDPLWELLGKARQPVVSPFFAHNVARAARSQEQERSWRRWLRSLVWVSRPSQSAQSAQSSSRLFRQWQPLAATACLALAFTGGWAARVHRQHLEQQQLLTMARRVYDSPDYSVINDLDDLLDSEKNAAWLSADTTTE